MTPFFKLALGIFTGTILFTIAVVLIAVNAP
jgi:hypothetical protein